MKKIVFLALGILLSAAAMAGEKPAFVGQNYSGVYDCEGSNQKVGDYKVQVTLTLDEPGSYDSFGAYDYSVTTANAEVYHGKAVAHENRLALSLLINEGKKALHSTGVATMVKNMQDRWSFRKRYYDEDENGADFGTEYCIMRPESNKKQQSRINGKAPARS